MSLWHIRKLLFIMNASSSFQIMMRRFIELLFEIIIEKSNYLNKIFNKDFIIIEYINDFLYFLYNLEKWYNKNHFDFFNLCWEIEIWNIMIKKFNIVIIKITFHFLKNKINFLQYIQYQKAIFKIFIKDLQKYHDIIDIYKSEISSIITKNDIHDSLKMSESIFQIKWYVNIFLEFIFNDENNE